MKNITRFSLTAAATIILSASAFSQKALKKADQAYEMKQYHQAVTMYKQVFSTISKDKRPLVLYKQGLASSKINDYKGAEAYFQKAIASNFDDPTVYLHLAEVLKVQLKYPEAIVEYNNYKAKGGDAKKADLGVKSCELSTQWKENPMRYKIENMSLLNSKERDYSPSYSDKKYQTLIFSSTREGALGGPDQITGVNHADIYESKLDKNGKWSTPVLLPPSISSPVNEGSGWVSKKGDMLFFTRCPEEKGKQNHCGLFMAKKQGSTWGVPERLPFSLDSVSFRQPALSADGKVLYFSSAMSGGYGGLDIWSCTYDAKANLWGQPKNAGPAVNTEGQELYPTISDDGKRLFFSSDFHPGMGGLDLFMAEAGADGKFTKAVENLKYPLNSSYDDFDVIWEGKKNRGYFTSNREGGKGSDDIYSFNLPPLVFNLKGIVLCEGDQLGKGKGENVEGVKVKIVGSDGTINEFTTTKDGSYKLDRLKEKTTYTISTETGKNSKSSTFPRDGYLANKDQRVITTFGKDGSTNFTADFSVKPVVPNLRMPEIRYALGSFDLLPESKDSLLFLYNILKDNPTIKVELNSHTDTQGKAAANMTLSTARAQSCVDFLVKEKGIPVERLSAKGYGMTKPVISDAIIKAEKTKEGRDALHAKNRRTEFRVLSFDYVDPNAPKNPTNGNNNNGQPKNPEDGEEE